MIDHWRRQLSLAQVKKSRVSDMGGLLSSMGHRDSYSMQIDNSLESEVSSSNEHDCQYLVQGPVGTNDDGSAGNATALSEKDSPKNRTESWFYKTKLCKHFAKFGECRFGGEFALGDEQKLEFESSIDLMR